MTVLLHDGVGLTSPFGVLESLPTLIHEPDASRPCVHLVEGPMPKVFAACRAPIERLNFQPRFAAEPLRHPLRKGVGAMTVRPGVIAARRESLLILSVELLGPIGMHHPGRGCRDRDQRVLHHWRYTLHDIDGEPDTVLAVRTD